MLVATSTLKCLICQTPKILLTHFTLVFRYLRLKIDEDANGLAVLSSDGRHRVMERIGSPTTIDEVVDLLSNDEDQDYPIFRRGTEKDIVLTIATGIFDFNRREWSLYADNAKNTKPIAIFPMNM